jgi:two-component system, chemotaxis family, chemotaxis protein CheY
LAAYDRPDAPAPYEAVTITMARILVIEDDASARDFLKETLVAAGYEVRTAINGEEGMLCLRAYAPDLVVTDLLMPKKEGLETIREMRMVKPEARIVAISGAPPDWRVLEIAKELGASETLAKPFQPDDLLHAVARLLAPGPQAPPDDTR